MRLLETFVTDVTRPGWDSDLVGAGIGMEYPPTNEVWQARQAGLGTALWPGQEWSLTTVLDVDGYGAHYSGVQVAFETSAGRSGSTQAQISWQSDTGCDI